MRLIRKNAPSLIILDLMLPGMNGVDLCRRLRSEEHTVARFHHHAHSKASESTALPDLDVGADDYVAKPFSSVSYSRGCARS
jgi:DNA-binding response OmpR family regulator